MKFLNKFLLVFTMLCSVVSIKAQTGYGFAIGATEPLDSITFFDVVPGGFGKHLPFLIDSLIAGQAVIVKDKNGSALCCDSITLDLKGKIAFIDRGTCSFVTKCFNAWQRGALAVVIVNNVLYDKNDKATWTGIMPSGGNPKANVIDIPVVMISKEQGDPLKAKIAANSAGYFMGIYQPNETANDAFPITTGEWISPIMEYGEGAIGDTLATNANWYRYTATKSGKMSISSCGKGANTSLFLYALSNNSLSPLGKSLDACAKNAADTNKEASELKDIVVKSGTTYYIEWNDLASPDSFNFVLDFVKADSVDLTVKVDMKNETVDAAGVYVAGSFQGWEPAKTKCTNVVGTTIWTKTIRVKSDADYEYKFINGNAWGKDESVSGTCSKAGAFGNRYIVVGTDNIDMPTACFKSCDVCVAPPLVCDKDAIYCEDFEKFALGPLGKNKSPNWSVWDGDYAAAAPITITGENATSGKQSFKIEGLGQDAILKLGNHTKGVYTLKWKMFVPAGKAAYYNIQHDTSYGTNHVFANEVYFARNGQANFFVGNNPAVKLTYPKDKWFDIIQTVDINKDSAYLNIGSANTIKWKWSIASKNGTLTTNSKLQGVNFYADSTFSKYYIDDVQLLQPKRSVTFSVDMKNEKVDSAGVHIAGDFQKAAGFAADWNEKSIKLTKGTGTIYSVTVQIPDGDYQYKFINGNAWGKDETVKGLACDAGGFGNRGVSVVGKDVTIPAVCFKKCYACDIAAVTFAVDLSKETAISVDGVSIAGSFQKAAGGTDDWAPGKIFLKKVGTTKVYAVTVGIPIGKYKFKYLNGKAWGTDESASGDCAEGGFGDRLLEIKTADDLKLDTVCFRRCFSCNKTAVNFVVDMSNEKTISADGISIAGDFQKAAGGAADWTPGVIFLTAPAGSKIYAKSIVLPEGNYKFKYLNGKAWGTDETVKGTCAVAGGGDRVVAISAAKADFKLDTTCFRYCVSCKIASSTNDAAFDAALSLYPNPAQTEVTLNYNFTQTTNITVSILNTLGQVLHSEKLSGINAGSTNINTLNLADGVYMIQVTDDKNRQSVKRLMIQK